MTTSPLTARQQAILDALDHASGGIEWIEATTLVFRLRQGGHDVSAIGVGKTLAGLATRGLCEQRHEGYMSRYRSQPRPEAGS